MRKWYQLMPNRIFTVRVNAMAGENVLATFCLNVEARWKGRAMKRAEREIKIVALDAKRNKSL